MLVTIEYQTGATAVRKSWLRAGQRMQVGRGEETDLPVPLDRALSRRHFELSCDEAAVRVRDLGSRNGTFLNGQRIPEAIVGDGDCLSAGETTFVVRIQLSAATARPAATERSQASAPASPARPAEESTITSQAGGAARAGQPLRPDAPVEQALVPAAERESGRSAPPTAVVPSQAPAPTPPPAADGTPSAPIRNQPSRLQTVVLEVVSSELAGRRWWLQPGQRATIGRTHEANLVIETDRQLSAVHCELTADSAACRIRDCHSRGGTFLNGDAIREAVLCHGDRVRVGQTEFQVSLVGGAQAAEDSPTRRSAAIVKDARPEPGLRPEYVQERCPSGLALFRGVTELQPMRLARLLVRAAPLYAVADFGRVPAAAPDALAERRPVFPGPEFNTGGSAAPLLIGASDVSDFDALMEATWGQDALVLVLSRCAPQDLWEALRNLTQAGLPTAEPLPAGAILGWCWPSVLQLLLQHTPPERAASLLPGVDAYLLEAPPPGGWQLFARESFAAVLDKLGFIRRPV